MKSWRTFVIAAAAIAAAAAPSYAQEKGPGPGTVELTIIPGGGLFFVSGASESKFRNYDVGGALTVNLNPYAAVEAEGSAALGVNHQRLAVGNLPLTEAPPNILDFSANMTLSAPGGTHRTVPYAIGGVGSMVVLTHTDLGIGAMKGFFTGNVGGGLKWYASGRWGLRADYRFVMIRSSDAAPEFFGREGRFAHRIYGGVILNLVE
jgi:lipoprotein-anchoring transpeptidase ErfK/SrfK